MEVVHFADDVRHIASIRVTARAFGVHQELQHEADETNNQTNHQAPERALLMRNK